MPRQASDAACLAILEVLTPEQVSILSRDQVRRFSTALDRWSVVLNTVKNELPPTDAAVQDVPTAEPPIAEPPIETEDAPFPSADIARAGCLFRFAGSPSAGGGYGRF